MALVSSPEELALRYACELGYLHRVQELLSSSSLDINAAFQVRLGRMPPPHSPQNGLTALHIALLNYHPEVAELLIRSGADIHRQDQMGFTPFHLACRRCYYGLVLLLFERGAEINRKDINGYTPLALACKDDDATIAEFLVDKVDDVNTQCKVRHEHFPCLLCTSNC